MGTRRRAVIDLAKPAGISVGTKNRLPLLEQRGLVKETPVGPRVRFSEWYAALSGAERAAWGRTATRIGCDEQGLVAADLERLLRRWRRKKN